jgi:hypothetical protein
MDACRDRGVDVILAEELVTYANARMLSRMMGWGGDIVENDDPKKGDSCVLHGDGGVATGIIWSPKLIRAISTGQIVTSGSINRKATHGRFYVEDKKLGLSVFHHEYRPKGPNDEPFYDRIRYRQMDAVGTKLVKSNQSHISAGDANHDKDDKPDSVGNAAREHGMVDFDVASKNRKNGNITLTKTSWGKGGRIIRGFATKDIQLTAQDTVRMYNWTDHNMLLQEFTVPA